MAGLLERIVCVGACAGTLLLPGCETTDSGNALLTSTIFKGAAVTANDPRKATAFGLLGDLYGQAAQIEGQKEASGQVADAIRERNSGESIYHPPTSEEIIARVENEMREKRLREFYAERQRVQLERVQSKERLKTAFLSWGPRGELVGAGNTFSLSRVSNIKFCSPYPPDARNEERTVKLLIKKGSNGRPIIEKTIDYRGGSDLIWAGVSSEELREANLFGRNIIDFLLVGDESRVSEIIASYEITLRE